MAWYDSPDVRRALEAGEQAAGAADVLLARHREGQAAWNSGPARRQRVASLEAQARAERSAARRAEIFRLEVLAEAEASRVRLPRSHDRAHSRACTGPVANYERQDPRWRDCTEHWPPGPGECPCGCGGGAGVVSRQQPLFDEEAPLLHSAAFGTWVSDTWDPSCGDCQELAARAGQGDW